MEEADNEKQGFSRDLTFIGALAIGLGTMLGAGIFVLSADAAQQAGPGASISFLIAGLIVLPTAMVVSELATAMPKEGGSYHLISRTLGPLAGAVVGPANWLGLIFATGFYLIGFASFAEGFIPLPRWVIIIGIGGLFIGLNYRGAELTGRVQRLIVGLLVLLLLGFSGLGWTEIEPRLHEPFLPEGWGGVLAAVSLIIVSYTGFEKISTVAEEIRDPGKNLPRAIIGSVLIATAIYAAVLYVFTGLLPHGEIPAAETALVEASRNAAGRLGGTAMLIGGLLATASSVNAAILASSRINFAMGRDRMIPGWFGKIHREHRTPHRAIVVTGGASVLLALSGTAAALAEISSALFMVSYALLAAGVVLMRHVSPEWYKPSFRVPLYPWLPVLGGLAAVGVILTMDLLSQVVGLGLAALSVAWYVLWGRRHTQIHGELGEWLKRLHPLERLRETLNIREEPSQPEGAEILVAVESARTSPALVTLGVAFARQQKAALLIGKAVVVPRVLALADAEAQLTPREADPERIVERAVAQGRRAGVPTEQNVVVGRSVAASIANMARNRPSVRLAVSGWQAPGLSRSLRAAIDDQIERGAPCDTAVLLDRGLEDVRRILVPVSNSPHARLALQLAEDLRAAWSAELEVVHVVTEEDPQPPGAWLGEEGQPEGRTVQARSVTEGIVEEARRGFDLVVLGSSNAGALKHRLFGGTGDAVAERVPCSALLVRAEATRPPE